MNYLNQLKDVFWSLSWRLETFTSIIPIPTFVYFVAVTGAFEGEDRLMTVALAGLFAGSATVLWGLLYRYFALKTLLGRMTALKSSPTPDVQEKIRLRNDFLRYPYREGRTIIARWTVGSSAGALFYILLMGEIPFYSLGVEFFSLIFVLPISYVMYLFMTESILHPLLRDSVFAGLPPAGRAIRETSYFTRMLLAIVSVTITPIAIFGFILYSTMNGTMSFKHPEVHIILLSLEALAAIIIVAYRIAKSVKLSISDTNESLQELGKGNFEVNSSRTTTDEFGRQAELLDIVVRDLSKMYTEVQELNENLEQKVIHRTEELNSSLQEIRKLKQHQDGDYFLTSLLLKPLNSNRADSEQTKVEFFIRQKKKFEFKNKQHDIGGDICSAHSILLRNRRYTAFLNADAMGKSMQGAGGALVLGAVYYSIIERTKASLSVAGQSPERWLKNTFLELHKVFESFDGSMLISLVMGLVDDESGLIYYINAEHPWTVLYRNKVATFIEREQLFRKLGMTAVQGNIFIRTFQLERGDVLICGSDGRDDLMIESEAGQKMMNENEELFLDTVRECGPDLGAIYKMSSELGEISDDFSLLKLEYIGNEVKAEKKSYSRKQSAHYYKLKDYGNAVKSGEDYLNSAPSDTEFMRYLSRCHRLAGNYDAAMDLAERVRLRDPEDVKNLQNLAGMYLARKNFNRAKELADELQRLAPHSTALQKIKSLLEKR